MYYDSKWFLNYFRLTPDGRMLWGGRNDLSTDLDLDDSAKRLTRELYSILPDLRDIPITHTWTGKLGITFDLMPHIGEKMVSIMLLDMADMVFQLQHILGPK